MIPKRMCVITPILKSEFSFLRDADEVVKSFRTLYKPVFVIEHDGR